MERQSRLQNRHATFVSAKEACELLQIKPATLYTYVSRGLVHRVSTGRKRYSRYSLADILQLKSRADARAGHGPVAAEALNWGQPVIRTSISTVGESAGLTYRGQPLLELVRGKSSFETIAELLWRGERPARRCRWPAASTDQLKQLRTLPTGANPYIVAGTLLPLLAAADPSRFILTADTECQRARRAIRLIAASVALPRSPQRAARAVKQPRIAKVLATALGLADRETSRLDAILILCAEHELNASTFAARVAASTHADLYACLGAAVGVHSGPRQGQSVDRVLSLLDEARQQVSAAHTMNARLERGEAIAGFGHQLYPHGDPRFLPLYNMARRRSARNPDVRILSELVDACRIAGYHPPQSRYGDCHDGVGAQNTQGESLQPVYGRPLRRLGGTHPRTEVTGQLVAAESRVCGPEPAGRSRFPETRHRPGLIAAWQSSQLAS